MKLYKYNQKNNKNRTMSRFNGVERVGFSMVTCKSQSEIDAATAKGFAPWPPVKVAKKPAEVKVDSNDGQNSKVHSPASAEGNTAGNGLPSSD